jgi:hypothetical protein
MNSDKKDCFGVLHIVFPIGDNGLRESPPECFQCSERTACLKAALKTKEGLAMKGEVLDRAAESGMVGRFKRWSRKKEFHRLMKGK